MALSFDRPNSSPHSPADPSQPLPGVIGAGSGMREVARTTRQVAPSRACVLIVGETGTGKELIARAIHDLSNRASGPYIRVNCGALTESLLESELFGHVKGSFTSAVENRTGRFEAAHTGTIFLDEINSTSPKLQVKLLRVLQEGEFERVGDIKTIRVDTRFIAATNRDLQEEIEAGRFREDLYYRLNVVPIYLPPLRERRDDIPELVKFFLKRYGDQNRRETSAPSTRRPCACSWSTTGPATSASCKTTSNAPSFWGRGPKCCPSTCPLNSGAKHLHAPFVPEAAATSPS